MEGTTQLTNWISWALDIVLDNLLRTSIFKSSATMITHP